MKWKCPERRDGGDTWTFTTEAGRASPRVFVLIPAWPFFGVVLTATRQTFLSGKGGPTITHHAVVKEVEVRKWIFPGDAVGVTGLCLLGSSGIAQAKTTPTITPSFIAKVNTFCASEATQITTAEGGSFPYPNFNPYAPDVKTMRLAGAFFAKALSVRQVVPQQLEAVGEPTSGPRQWNDLKAIDAKSNRIAITQVHDAQAGNVKGFVSTVRQLTSVQNDLVKEAVKDGFTKSSPCTEDF